MGEAEYSSMVAARSSSIYDQYTRTGGTPTPTAGANSGAGAIEVSAMMVAVGVVAAAVF